MMRGRAWPLLLCEARGLAALAAIWAAYFGGVVLARGYLFFGDVTWQDYPFRVFYTAQLRAGHLPLWNPFLFGGFQQFAEGQSGSLYPLSMLLALLLSPHVALTWLVMIHRLLAGWFMFLLARGWRLPRSSAFVAGLVYMFCGFFFVQSQHWGLCSSAAYIPLVLYFIEVGMRRRRAIYALPTAAVVAAQVLIGASPITYLSAYAAIGYAALRAVSLGPRATARLAVALGLGAVVIGGLLAAVQALPTLDLARQSMRTVQTRLDFITSFGVPPRLLGLFLAPNTWGNPAYGDYHGPLYYWEYCDYVGIPALALAALALARRWRDYWVWAALGLISLALAVGRLNPLYHVLQYVPGVNLFRVPARYLLIVSVGLAFLAGAGHQVLLSRARAAGRSARWAALFLGSLAAWAGLTFLILPAPMRYSMAWGGGLAPLAVALLALTAALLVVGAWRGAFSRLTLTAFASGLILADLLPWGATQMPTVGASYFTDPPSTARAMLRDRGWFRMITWRRVFGPMSPTQWPDAKVFRALREYLAPDIPAAYGIRTLEGYSGFSPARPQAFFHLARIVFRQGDQDTRLLDAAGVKYIVSEQPLREGRLERVRRGRVSVYRNPGFLGPCWVVPQAVVLPDADQVVDYMASSEFRPDRVVVLEAPLGPFTGTPERFRGEARALRLEPTRMEFEAEASDPGVLVINAAAYDPGWAATLDGERVPVYPANETFQAVYLPAGPHRITFRYDSLPYAAGRQISLATAFALVVALGWWARRKRALPAP